MQELLTQQTGCNVGGDLQEKHTQVSASSKEQGRKCLGIQLCQKKRKDNGTLQAWTVCARASTESSNNSSILSMEIIIATLFDVHLSWVSFLTFHPRSVGRI